MLWHGLKTGGYYAVDRVEACKTNRHLYNGWKSAASSRPLRARSPQPRQRRPTIIVLRVRVHLAGDEQQLRDRFVPVALALLLPNASPLSPVMFCWGDLRCADSIQFTQFFTT